MTVKAPGPMTNLSSLRLRGSRVCRSRQPPDMTIIVAKKEAVGLQLDVDYRRNDSKYNAKEQYGFWNQVRCANIVHHHIM